MKYLKLIIAVILIITLSACSNTKLPQKTSEPLLDTDISIGTETVSVSDITVMPSSEPTPKDTSPDDKYVGFDIPYILSVVWNYTAEDFISGISELDLEGIDALPVYKDLYPTGQEGYLFEITEDMISGFKNNIITFLHMADIYDSDNKIDIKDEGTKTARCSLETKDLIINAGINGLSIITKIDNYELEDSDDDVLKIVKENKLMTAALKYLGIKNPSISSEEELNIDSELFARYYTVFDEGDSYAQALYNRSFNYMRILAPMEADGSTLIQLIKTDTSVDIGSYKLIPVNRALFSLCYRIDDEITPDMILAAELLYTKKIINGYFVPCYIFYVDEGPTYRDPKVHNFVTYYYPAIEYEHLTDAMSEAGEINTELSFMNDYLNSIENTVFLLPLYSKPENIDLSLALCDNAAALYSGVTEEEIKKELDEIAENTAGAEGTYTLDVTKVTQAYADKLFKDKLGMTFDISSLKESGWHYIKEADAYYLQHGGTELDKIKCISISDRGDGTISVLYHMAFRNTDRTVTLKKTAQGYMFVSNLENSG